MLRSFPIIAVIAFALCLAPSTVAGAIDARKVTVRLQPVGDAKATGTASLSAIGRGTRVAFDVSGLPARARIGAQVHAGTCARLDRLSASFAQLPGLRADAAGRATATGRVRRPIGPPRDIALSVLADGQHAIILYPLRRSRGLTACGTIQKQ